MDKDDSQMLWRVRLAAEMAAGSHLPDLSPVALHKLVLQTSLTSKNHDTGISLDFPHFCSGATSACGGKDGWCYTFSGNLASAGHDRKVALVDFIATRHPAMFAEKVTAEVKAAVHKGVLTYPNLRYAGSGEVALKHLPSLKLLKANGIQLWGFTKRIEIARALRSANISVIFSLDRTSPGSLVELIGKENFPSSYVSHDIGDQPASHPFVTFPLHIQGQVHEVVDAPNLCPKVLAEFFEGHRPSGTCQTTCTRCHNPKQDPTP